MFKNTISKQKNTIAVMIKIFCKNKHSSNNQLCNTCSELLLYAIEKLDKCPFKDNKPTCNKCTVHCYQSDYRQKVREVMIFSGKRMFLRHPILSLYHLLQTT